MKTIIISLLAVAFLAGCASRGEQYQRFTLIWRQTSGIPIENVPTPDGFKISPAEAVKPINALFSRMPSSEDYLLVDATNYYFGNTHQGAEIVAPHPESTIIIINGTTGKMSDYIDEKDTEQLNQP